MLFSFRQRNRSGFHAGERSLSRPSPHLRRGLRPRAEALDDRCLLSFGNPISTAVPHPEVIVSADVNRDGNADLVVANGSGIGGYVLLGNGDGHFNKARYPWGFTSGSYTDATLAVADINGDGKLDIVAGNDPNDGGAYGEKASVGVLLGDGRGGFTPFQNFTWGFNVDMPRSIAVSDVNGDGMPDILVAGYGGGVDVLLNGGNDPNTSAWHVQSYSTAGLGSTTGGPLLVAVGDVNGDTKPDILVAGGTQVDVLLNTGTGAFGAPQAYDAGGAVTAVTVGDVNGDGHLDIVTANGDWSNYSRSVSVLLGHGDGTFGAARTYPTGGSPTSIALGDLNHDGKPDIVTTGTEMDVLLNNGDGTFGPSQKVGPAGRSVVVADFNNDGLLDLAQIDGSGTSVDVLLNGATSKTKGKK
jgi:hypothetical protein